MAVNYIRSWENKWREGEIKVIEPVQYVIPFRIHQWESMISCDKN
jgi:hypothetical protein